MTPTRPRSALSSLLGAALLLLTPGSAIVFNATVFTNTFSDLGSRGCLPGDFDFSHILPIAPQCAGKVSTLLASTTLPEKCAGAPILPLFYSCFANSNDIVVQQGQTESFNTTAFEISMLSYTDDQDWNQKEREMMAACKRSSSASLAPQQQSVFSYCCARWSLYAECDQQQGKTGTLDDQGKLRRAKFLSGDCPLSPSKVFDAFGMVTNQTWAACDQGYTGNNASLLYEAGISRTTCLLQNFEDNGNVDFPTLEQAINDADTGDLSDFSHRLIQLLKKCAGKQQGAANKYEDMTPEEFVKCWAGHGMFSCAIQEANQVAREFPKKCALTVDDTS